LKIQKILCSLYLLHLFNFLHYLHTFALDKHLGGVEDTKLLHLTDMLLYEDRRENLKKNPRWFDKNPQVTLVDKNHFAAL
jgi:hypothetical protein